MQILKRVFILSLLVMFFIPITKNQTSSSEHIHFPVVDLRFYEQPHEGVPYFDRVYANYFPADTTRQIAYEINFENPAPGRIVQIPITIKCHRSDGALVEEKHTTLTLQPEWTKWWHSGVLAISEAGNWKPDTYTVSIYDQGREIASEQFTILYIPKPGSDEWKKADRLSEWAQAFFPELFPFNPDTKEIEGILYRHYPEAETYLATYMGNFYCIYQDVFQYSHVIELGTVDSWIDTISDYENEAGPQGAVIEFSKSHGVTAKVNIPAGALTEHATILSGIVGNQHEAAVSPAWRIDFGDVSLCRPVEIQISGFDGATEPLYFMVSDRIAGVDGASEMFPNLIEATIQDGTAYFTIPPSEQCETGTQNPSITPVNNTFSKSKLQKQSPATKTRTSLTFWAISGYASMASDNFRLTYPTAILAETIDIPERILTYAEEAYNRLKNMGYRFRSEINWPVQINVNFNMGETEGEVHIPLSGKADSSININAALCTAENLRQLKATIGHEFFHVVQSIYDPRSGLRIRHSWTTAYFFWLAEASSVWFESIMLQDPDYTANVFVQNIPYYYKKGLETYSSKDEAQHMGYAASGFIRYLADNSSHGNNVVRRIWEAVRNQGVTRGTYSDLRALKNSLGSRYETGRLFSNYMAKLLTNNTDYLYPPSGDWPRFRLVRDANFERAVTVNPSSSEYEIRASIEPFAAHRWRFTFPDVDPDNNSYSLVVLEDAPTKYHYFVYRGYFDGTESTLDSEYSAYLTKEEPWLFDAQQNDQIVVVAVNTTTDAPYTTSGELAVKLERIEETTVSIAGNDFTRYLDSGATSYTHVFTASAQPAGRYTYRWDTGDGSAHAPQSIEPGQISSLRHTFHSLQDGDEFRVLVNLYDEDNNLLDSDSINVRFAMSTVSITGGDITHQLGEDDYEHTHSFEASAQPPGSYTYQWDFGDGSARITDHPESGEKSSVTKTYTNLKHGDEFSVQVTLYDIDARPLATDSVKIKFEKSQTGSKVHNTTKDTWHDTIQEAIDAASDGDNIVVPPGTYEESIDFLGKNIRVVSSAGPESTIIDRSRFISGQVKFGNGENNSAELSGFTLIDAPIRISNGSWPVIHNNHGSIRIIDGSAAAITDNTLSSLQIIRARFDTNNISGNTIERISIESSTVVISNNIINGEISLRSAANSTIENNIITDSDDNGITIYEDDSNLRIINNGIVNNEGYGITVTAGTITVSNSIIADNDISDNKIGGIFLNGDNNTIKNNIIMDNLGAHPLKGNIPGVEVRGDNLIIKENTISNNPGRGILARGSGNITSNTVRANRDGGIRVAGNFTVSDNSISENRTDDSGGGISINSSIDSSDYIELGIYVIENNFISNNFAKLSGGGIMAAGRLTTGTEVTITGNNITGNEAGVSGGGLYGAATDWDLSVQRYATTDDDICPDVDFGSGKIPQDLVFYVSPVFQPYDEPNNTYSNNIQGRGFRPECLFPDHYEGLGRLEIGADAFVYSSCSHRCEVRE